MGGVSHLFIIFNSCPQGKREGARWVTWWPWSSWRCCWGSGSIARWLITTIRSLTFSNAEVSFCSAACVEDLAQIKKTRNKHVTSFNIFLQRTTLRLRWSRIPFCQSLTETPFREARFFCGTLSSPRMRLGSRSRRTSHSQASSEAKSLISPFESLIWRSGSWVLTRLGSALSGGGSRTGVFFFKKKLYKRKLKNLPLFHLGATLAHLAPSFIVVAWWPKFCAMLTSPFWRFCTLSKSSCREPSLPTWRRDGHFTRRYWDGPRCGTNFRGGRRNAVCSDVEKGGQFQGKRKRNFAFFVTFFGAFYLRDWLRFKSRMIFLCD